MPWEPLPEGGPLRTVERLRDFVDITVYGTIYARDGEFIGTVVAEDGELSSLDITGTLTLDTTGALHSSSASSRVEITYAAAAGESDALPTVLWKDGGTVGGKIQIESGSPDVFWVRTDNGAAMKLWSEDYLLFGTNGDEISFYNVTDLRFEITSTDITIRDSSGSTVAYWDDSESEWRYNADVNLQGNSLLNVAGASTGALGEYQAWTPSSYIGLTVGNGNVVARYARAGNLVHAWYKLVFGSTSAVTGDIAIALPVSPHASIAANENWAGGATFRDSSGGRYHGIVHISSTDRVLVRAMNTSGTYGGETALGATVPFTWATGDTLAWSVTYEAA